MKKRIQHLRDSWQQLPIVRKIIIWSKRKTPSAFSGVSLHDIIVFIAEELKKDDLPTRANSVAFSFFLSIFPFIIFVLPIISQTTWAEVYIDSLMTSVEGVLPHDAREYLFGIIRDIQSHGGSGLQGISIVLAMFFASNGMLTLMYGFDKSYEISFKSRSYFKNRLVAVNLTLLFAFILFISVVLVVLGGKILGLLGNYFDLSVLETFIFMLFRWMIVVLLFYSVITVIYRYGPSLYRPLKLLNPGAILATTFSLLASTLFSYLINTFGRYNELYGSIGALVVVLLWLQINAFIILAGFELNASIIVNRDVRYRKKVKKVNTT